MLIVKERLQPCSMTSTLLELWDFSDPTASEARFVEAISQADAKAAFILSTQVARTYGLRGYFSKAKRCLQTLRSNGLPDNLEAQAYYYLEWGRAYCSTAHQPQDQTEEARAQARMAYTTAFELASAAGLDYLAVDSLHMMTVVDTDPSQQVLWNQKALAYLKDSDQQEAKKWEASLRNNLGYALHLQGEYELALDQFTLALDLRIKEGIPGKLKIAQWMIAWTLMAMGRYQESLEMQLKLEQEWKADGGHDVYVWEELEHLYRALGMPEL